MGNERGNNVSLCPSWGSLLTDAGTARLRRFAMTGLCEAPAGGAACGAPGTSGWQSPTLSELGIAYRLRRFAMTVSLVLSGGWRYVLTRDDGIVRGACRWGRMRSTRYLGAAIAALSELGIASRLRRFAMTGFMGVIAF